MVGVPTIYADQPAGIQAGPYNIKITLGVVDDDDSDYPRPIATVVMPTTHVMRMVEELQALFAHPDFLSDARMALEDDIRNDYSAAKGRPESALKSKAVRRLEK